MTIQDKIVTEAMIEAGYAQACHYPAVALHASHNETRSMVETIYTAMSTAQEPALDDDAVAWLVEFPQVGDAFKNGVRIGPARDTCWLAGGDPSKPGSHRTSDANQAIRFARQVDAAMFIRAHLDPAYKAFPSEHMWIGADRIQAKAPETGEG